MDEVRFDALSRTLAAPARRRATLRLLAGGMLGAWLTRRGAGPARAAPPAQVCTPVGGACSSNTCCQPDPNYTYGQCCFDANGAGVCTDVFASGLFRCPDPGVPAAGCTEGLTDCGGVCTSLATDNGNCGACGSSCPGDSYCNAGICTRICTNGLTNCDNVCVDFTSDAYHCGACYNGCPLGGYCSGGVCGGVICEDGLLDCYGRCVDIETDESNCGGCGLGCFEGLTCIGGQCFDRPFPND